MTHIEELIIAVGYALDAGNPERDKEHRKDCREKAERILKRLIDIAKKNRENEGNSRQNT